eukprot:287355-Pleurochrysis_carterae.AAC.1
MTDGASACSAAEGESQIFLRTQREHAALFPSAPVHSVRKETCATHAEAREEAHCLEAAFLSHRLLSATRLLHKCSFMRAQGYGHEFKKIWVKRCGYTRTLSTTAGWASCRSRRG